jgi:hypothetical protein
MRERENSRRTRPGIDGINYTNGIAHIPWVERKKNLGRVFSPPHLPLRLHAKFLDELENGRPFTAGQLINFSAQKLHHQHQP